RKRLFHQGMSLAESHCRHWKAYKPIQRRRKAEAKLQHILINSTLSMSTKMVLVNKVLIRAFSHYINEITILLKLRYFCYVIYLFRPNRKNEAQRLTWPLPMVCS